MKKHSTLKLTLTTNFILLGIIPVLVVGITSLLIITRSISSEVRTKNFNIATSLSGQVETFLGEPLSLLQQVDSVILQEAIVSPSEISPYLQVVVKNYPFFEMIQLTDSNGIIKHLAPYNRDYIDTDMSLQPFFQKTKKHLTPIWSPTFISMQSGHPTITLSIPASGGGILAGYVNLSILSSMVSKISGQHNYAVILDQEGTIIADSDRQRVQQRINLRHLEPVKKAIQGKFGTFVVEDKEIKLIMSSVKQPITGWLIAYIQHYDDAFSPTFKIRQMLVFGVILTLLLAIAVAVLRARSVTEPLAQLMKSSRVIAGGDYNPPPAPHVFQEFKELDESLKTMAKAIDDRERRISESERRHRQLLEAIPYGIQEADNKGIITFTNSAHDKIFEIEKGDVIGRELWRTAVSKKDRQILKDYFFQLVAEQPEPTTYFAKALTGKKKLIDIQVDWQYKRAADGSLLGFTSVITDITDKKQLERSLRQAQKMEAIGTLAGGIAHDFNNILAAILGYSELVLDDLDRGSIDYQYQQQVIKASHRAKELVQHLLLFSRKQEHEKGPLNCSLIVKEALELLRATIPSTITFTHDIEKNCGPIEANPTQIHQVILNLCTNAAHAMENRGGTLHVTTKRIALEGGRNKPRPEMSSGEYVMIAVADAGEGIAPKDLERIFEPFFTTKETGKGTGMGLAVVHGIVSSHGGHIFVHSEPGKGTEFQLYFPIIEGAEEVTESEKVRLTGDGQHILVVDDEEPIARYAEQVLKRLGYKVTVETESTRALALFQKLHSSIDLVITDQTMPEIAGSEMAKIMLALRPDIPIILCTGYSSTITEEEAKAIGIAAYVMKPFTMQHISQSVSETLEKKSPPSN